MLKEERQEKIIRFLQDRDYCSAVLLSKTFYASLPTIRRDLAELEKKGFINRCRGGAILLDNNRTDIPFPFRLSTHAPEKNQLCLLASTLVRDGDVLFIDESSTTQHMVEWIRHRQNLTVITNSIAVCNMLYQTDMKTYCTGGCLQNSSCSFVGRQAERYVTEFNVDLVFFSASSLNEEGFITDYSEEGTHLRQAVFHHARKKVFLCDHSKLGKNAAYKVCSLHDLDYLVTDFNEGTDFSAFPQVYTKNGCYLFSKS